MPALTVIAFNMVHVNLQRLSIHPFIHCCHLTMPHFRYGYMNKQMKSPVYLRLDKLRIFGKANL